MFKETTDKISAAAVSKAAFLRAHVFKYFLASALAGMYVGLGIVLIFSLGAPFAQAGSPALKILMGVSFGVALTLVIMAGAELFTGNNMTMIIGNIGRKVSAADTALVWVVSYAGNLAGSLFIGYLFAKSGLMSDAATSGFVQKISAIKMHAPAMDLFVRGILCNMLVCLAVWMCFKLKEETAKVLVIFWCLFAFISSGFEHSVANMSLLSFPLFTNHVAEITWLGYFRNLLWVSLGNIVGGGVIIGAAYAFISQEKIKG